MLDVWCCSSRLQLDPSSSLVKFFMSIRTNNDPIWPLDECCDQYSNQHQLYIISFVVNFSCELRLIITRYDDLLEDILVMWAMFTPTPTWHNFIVVNFACEWANYDQMWLPRTHRSDFEQCLNWLQLDRISFWSTCHVNCQIITKCEILEARWTIFSNIGTDCTLVITKMTKLGFLWSSFVMHSNVWTNINIHILFL